MKVGDGFNLKRTKAMTNIQSEKYTSILKEMLNKFLANDS